MPLPELCFVAFAVVLSLAVADRVMAGFLLANATTTARGSGS